MTPKQRFEAAMSFKQPDDIAAFMEIEFHSRQKGRIYSFRRKNTCIYQILHGISGCLPTL